jgi:hypothetical protein
MIRAPSRLLLIAIPCLAALPSLPAQCANQWVSTGGIPCVSSIALCSRMYDPDGAGPAPARLVVGGAFSAVGNTAANNVAAWDPATGAWSPLGTGLSGGVNALATLPNGELVAANGATVSRWNGASWLPMGADFTDLNTFPYIATLTVDTNGDLIAGGQFTSAGGTPANNVARWNGTAWSALGTGTNEVVLASATLPTGGVVVGGRFTQAGWRRASRTNCNCIAGRQNALASICGACRRPTRRWRTRSS